MASELVAVVVADWTSGLRQRTLFFLLLLQWVVAEGVVVGRFLHRTLKVEVPLRGRPAVLPPLFSILGWIILGILVRFGADPVVAALSRPPPACPTAAAPFRQPPDLRRLVLAVGRRLPSWIPPHLLLVVSSVSESASTAARGIRPGPRTRAHGSGDCSSQSGRGGGRKT